jgi:hypothetical protein
MKHGSTFYANQPKIAVTVQLDQELVNKITDLKTKFQQCGKYFSITGTIDRAIRKAVKEGSEQIEKTDETWF